MRNRTWRRRSHLRILTPPTLQQPWQHIDPVPGTCGGFVRTRQALDLRLPDFCGTTSSDFFTEETETMKGLYHRFV